MKIPELTPELRAELKRAHAHRFPELRFFPKPDEQGGKVKLPIVLGNPSGACAMPKGEHISRAWSQKVAETFGAAGGDESGDALVSDCVLWPDGATWTEWVQRWPALVKSVRPALVDKYGGSIDQVSQPDEGTEAPAEIAAARSESLGSSWLRFEPKQKIVVDLVVKTPTSPQWAMFTEEMKRPNAEHWKLALELAKICTVASSMPAIDAFGQWPGLALIVDRQAAYLAGNASEYEEGEL